MVKLDANVLRYMTRDEFRVLTAIEMGQKNHEIVPTPLIARIAGLKKGGASKAITLLHKNKLIYHSNQQYDGYKLTFLGYDYLALKTLAQRGQITGIGRRIGVGKESDVYEVINETDEKKEVLVLKIHRLGRTSFRAIKNTRDYLLHRKSASWLYLSRLAALREFAYMKALYDHGFPVPTPRDQNRHCVLMSFVDATPFSQIRELRHPSRVYSNLMNLIVKLAEHGLIHCDFNEFNIMLAADEAVTLIDFPQMVSTSHKNAKSYFDRDVQCIRTYFSRKFKFDGEEYPQFFTDAVKEIDLDVQLCASGAGFTEKEQAEFDRFIEEKAPESADETGADEGEGDEGDDNAEEGDLDDGDGDGEVKAKAKAPAATATTAATETKAEAADGKASATAAASEERKSVKSAAADGDGDGKSPSEPAAPLAASDTAPQVDDAQLEEVRTRVKRRLQKKQATGSRSRNTQKARDKRSLAHQIKSDI